MAHLIFVCKYRKRLLDRLGVDVKSIMYTIAEDNGNRQRSYSSVNRVQSHTKYLGYSSLVKTDIHIPHLEKQRQHTIFAQALLEREHILERWLFCL